MKKVLFLQNNGKSFGGVWQVNKLLGESLIEKGYDVTVVSIRNNKNNLVVEHSPKLKVVTINEEEEWGTYNGSEIIFEIRKRRIISAMKMLMSRIKYNLSLKKDIKKLHTYLDKLNPDYIIVSHYQVLDMIPKKNLNITINVQHSSFKDAINHKATRNTLDKYKNKIKYVWLTKNTMNEALNHGIKNSAYIYNAVRFKSDEIADTTKNKKLITIARLSKDKDIKCMIDIVKEVFKDKELNNWCLEIYGDGPELDDLKLQISNHKQIHLKGLTNNPKEVLLSSSINLNTSPYEGFSLSILEANECGVPTIAFNFGESTEEEIINNKTGIIAKDKDDYIIKLKGLMKNPQKLKQLSNNCKEYNKQFQIELIIEKWINIFNEIDKNKE